MQKVRCIFFSFDPRTRRFTSSSSTFKISVAIEELKSLISKAHISGEFSIKAYVPQIQYFTEVLPVNIPSALLVCAPSKRSFPSLGKRASEIAIEAVSQWLRRNGMDCFIIGYGEKSLTKFDLYVEIDWIDSAFRRRMKKRDENCCEKMITTTIPNSTDKTDIGNLNIQCGVCYENRRGAALIPCGHVFCWKCCTHVNLKKCPICNTPPLFAQRLFLP